MEEDDSVDEEEGDSVDEEEGDSVGEEGDSVDEEGDSVVKVSRGGQQQERRRRRRKSYLIVQVDGDIFDSFEGEGEDDEYEGEDEGEDEEYDEEDEEEEEEEQGDHEEEQTNGRRGRTMSRRGGGQKPSDGPGGPSTTTAAYQKYDRLEKSYYDRSQPDVRATIDRREQELADVRNEQLDVPTRFRVLLSSIPTQNAVAVLQRMRDSSDRGKAQQFANQLARIPFGKYSTLPIGPRSSREDAKAFLEGVKASMDSHVFGMDDVKRMFMITVARWASRPDAKGLVIGLRGPMGVGKTTLVKDGIGRALGIPSAFIALGSANDVTFLEGHTYTWEGSIPGQIAESVMAAGVMNPIFCFDELDKVDDNSKGNEIINSLIHVTDKTQNDRFCDKYFGGNLLFDLSRSIIVFTYNDPTKINPILKNRMVEISIKDYSAEEKLEIVRRHVVPKELDEYGGRLRARFADEALRRLATSASNGVGLRDVQHQVSKILGVVNLERMMAMSDDEDFEITAEAVETILKSNPSGGGDEGVPEGVRHMYI